MSSAWLSDENALALATAQACAFAATVPLLGGAPLRIVRAAMAISLIPLLIGGAHQAAGPVGWSVLQGLAIGLAFGLAASVIAGAVGGGASLIDAGLAWTPLAQGLRDSGPISRLYQAAFAVALFGSGGFTALVARFSAASAHLHVHGFSVAAAAELGRASFEHSVLLAGPAMVAQIVASLFAGLLTRAAPQINGMLLASPLVSAAVLSALIAGSGALLPLLSEIVRAMLSASNLALR